MSRTTLLNYHRSPHRRADNGTPGMVTSARKTGADIILPVPEGTVVKSMRRRAAGRLTGAGARFQSLRAVAAVWATRRWSEGRTAPLICASWVSRVIDVILELKSVADVAPRGFRRRVSSLIAAASPPRPDHFVYDAGFRTSVSSPLATRAVVADAPGLIPAPPRPRPGLISCVTLSAARLSCTCWTRR